MSRRVGILRAEGWAEGIDVRERAGEGLAFELSTHGEVGLLAKEILLGLTGRIGRHPKHLARSFAIARGDDGGVDVGKFTFIEKTMHRIGQTTPHPEDRAVEIGAGTQVGNRAKELRRVSFFLKRKIFRRFTEQRNLRRTHFPTLPLPRALNQFPYHAHRSTGVHFRNLIRSRNARIDDDLNPLETGTVIQFDKRKLLGIPPGPDPATEFHGGLGRFTCEKMFHGLAHGVFVSLPLRESTRNLGIHQKKISTTKTITIKTPTMRLTSIPVSVPTTEPTPDTAAGLTS